MKNFLGETSVDQKDTPYRNYDEEDWAIEYIVRYGWIDGAPHKNWVFDQVCRILKGTPIILKLAKWKNGQEEYRFVTGEPTEAYHDMVKNAVEDPEDWDIGCAP